MITDAPDQILRDQNRPRTHRPQPLYTVLGRFSRVRFPSRWRSAPAAQGGEGQRWPNGCETQCSTVSMITRLFDRFAPEALVEFGFELLPERPWLWRAQFLFVSRYDFASAVPEGSMAALPRLLSA